MQRSMVESAAAAAAGGDLPKMACQRTQSVPSKSTTLRPKNLSSLYGRRTYVPSKATTLQPKNLSSL